MKKLPKVNKNNHVILKDFKKGQIIRFGKSLSEDDIIEIAGTYGFGVWFYDPGTMEFQKFGKNTCRLT